MVAACQGNFSLSLIAEKILAENLVRRLPPIDLSECLMRIFNKQCLISIAYVLLHICYVYIAQANIGE